MDDQKTTGRFRVRRNDGQEPTRQNGGTFVDQSRADSPPENNTTVLEESSAANAVSLLPEIRPNRNHFRRQLRSLPTTVLPPVCLANLFWCSTTVPH
ncbi:hypothetical protein CA54_05290 [Symmachiella macrocystis]|uniref:Uncharacterized protein n=1 Tax=Symmachiella macrocystis TaxID=2527985 RepID=A0A5C6BIA6_9PLAN|nr:hypothetical protein CA54_05290 [Symmachiella macrocystis]